MDQEILVGPDIGEGREAITALQKSGFPLKAAYWDFDAEGSRWNLVLITPSSNFTQPLAAYGQVRRLFDSHNVRRSLDFSIFSATAPVYKALRREWKGSHDAVLDRKRHFGDTTIGPGYLYFVD